MRLHKSEYLNISDEKILLLFKFHLKELRKYISMINQDRINRVETRTTILNCKEQEQRIINTLTSCLRERKHIERHIYEDL